jgi:hypothetical protein
MKNINTFVDFINEDLKPLVTSGGDVTKMPIIGTISTVSIPSLGMRGESYDIVEIVETENKNGDINCIYVVNEWYKPGVPQLIHGDMVKKFEPNWLEVK